MKRLSTYLTLLVMAALPFTFTSCEEDWYDGYDWYDKPYYDATDYALDLAQTLSGTWEGTIINEYYNEDGEREQTKCDADFTFVQYRYDAINGTGYETDYDGQGNQQTLRFKWYVDYRTGNVNIEYVSIGYRFLLDSKGNSKYSGFSLDNNYFDGVMEGVNNDEFIFFSLNRVSGYNAPLKTKATDGAAKTVRFGKGERKQISDSDVPVMLRRR